MEENQHSECPVAQPVEKVLSVSEHGSDVFQRRQANRGPARRRAERVYLLTGFSERHIVAQPGSLSDVACQIHQ